MPLTRLTCPICLGTLKMKMPVAEGTRIRCPKCKGSFLAEAEPKAAALSRPTTRFSRRRGSRCRSRPRKRR